MIELTFLALVHRLMNWGLAPLIATRTVAADASALRALLAEPATHLQLAGGRPRNAEARVKPAASGRVVTVELLRAGRTLLWATWILTAGRGTTEVDLALQFETRGLATRLALVLGGRRWLARRTERALARLAQRCARAAEDVGPALASSPAATPAPATAPDPAPASASDPAAQCSGRARRRRRARDADTATRPR